MSAAAAKNYIKDKRGRYWSHKSVVALLNASAGSSNPESIIQKTARYLVAQAREIGWSGPPYDPKILASLRGIKVRQTEDDIGADARILPDSGGTLIIEYAPSKPQTRINFSICHELVHTFFPDCYETVRHRGKYCSADRSYFELEGLCDAGAAELLMPDCSFPADMQRLDYSISAIRELSALYIASTEAVLIRISQLSPLACAVVFLSEKLKPTQKRSATTMEFESLGLPPVTPKLRVDYVRPSELFDLYIPTDKSIPENSVAYGSLKTNDLTEGTERWDIPGFGLWRVQAVPLRPHDVDKTRRVAAIVYAS